MDEHLNLHQKLDKIRAISDVAKKSKKGYNYTYIDITDILANVSAGMKKYSVQLIPSMVPDTMQVCQNVMRNTKFDKQGRSYEAVSTEMMFQAQMLFTWVDSDNPEDKIEVPWYVVGAMPDCSQSLGAACTYGLRQFLTTYFQIAQADYDVDAYRSKQKEAEKAEDTAVAKSIIEEFDAMLKAYLAENPKRKDECIELVSNYVKGAKYSNIKDPRLAAKLLEDFTNAFIKGGNENA